MHTFENLAAQAAMWHSDRYEAPPYGDERRMEAIAKPAEEAGELIGAWLKLRRVERLRGRGSGERLVSHGEDSMLIQRGMDVETELADVIVSAMMAAHVIGVTPGRLGRLVANRLTEIEERPKNDPSGEHQ